MYSTLLSLLLKNIDIANRRLSYGENNNKSNLQWHFPYQNAYKPNVVGISSRVLPV